MPIATSRNRTIKRSPSIRRTVHIAFNNKAFVGTTTHLSRFSHVDDIVGIGGIARNQYRRQHYNIRGNQSVMEMILLKLSCSSYMILHVVGIHSP